MRKKKVHIFQLNNNILAQIGKLFFFIIIENFVNSNQFKGMFGWVNFREDGKKKWKIREKMMEMVFG